MRNSGQSGLLANSNKTNWILCSFDGFGKQAVAGQCNSSHQPPRRASKNLVSKDTWTRPVKKDHLVGDEVPVSSWSELYKPMIEGDLAVHKKKVAEVKHWLSSHRGHLTHEQGCGILLLTGPAGCGKTAVVEVLAKEIHCELLEWINPLTQEYEENVDARWNYGTHAGSQMQMFRDFLTRANRYAALNLSTLPECEHANKIVLIEDIPNIFYRDPKKLHDILRYYKASGRAPIVFIVSDTFDADASSHVLFPKPVQLELGMATISFNAVSTTSLVKNMVRIVNKAKGEHGCDLNEPNQSTLQLISAASHGDVRSCVNSLQFFCADGHADSSRSKSRCPSSRQPKLEKDRRATGRGGGRTKVDSMKSKRSSGDAAEHIPNIACKDTTLFLFRALGKVLYCKRTKLSCEEKTSQLPAHLQQHCRDALNVCPEEVFDQTHLTSDTFSLYLHQNYQDFFENVDEMSAAADALSIGDAFTGTWQTRDTMTEYAAATSMRGIMFALGANSTTSDSSPPASLGWKPLHKPQWFEVFRKTNSNARTGKDLFRDLRHPWIDLFTEVLPYLSKVRCQLSTPGHASFVKSLGCLPINRHQFNRGVLRKLDSDDNSVPSDEDSSSESSCNHAAIAAAEALVPTPDADVLEDEIEEFED